MTVTSRPLTQFGERLGIAQTDLAAHEGVERLVGTFPVSAERIAALTASDLQETVDAFGSALVVTISTGDLRHLDVRDGRIDADELDRLVRDAAGTVATYDVAVVLDKRDLAIDAHTATDVDCRVFLFGEALEAVLAEPPSEVERQLWADPARHLIIAMLDDQDAAATGPHLTILGGRYIASPPDANHATNTGETERMRRLRDRYVGWDSALDNGLTPAHLWCPGEVPPWLADRLSALSVGLGAMYICDRARALRTGGTGRTQVEFRGREHVAFVPIDWAASLDDVAEEHVTAVLDVVAWCYRATPDRDVDALSDRLPFVQTQVARLLEGREESDRLAALARAMPGVLESAKWHWRSFIEGRIHEYLTHVHDLEQAVQATVGRLSDQTALLVKRLTDTSLAAVAALVGSFVAAAYRDPFDADLFAIGMVAYAGYVLCVPLAVGVSSAVGDARLASAAFTAQQAALGEALGEDRVTHLAGDRPEKARRRFQFWARVTAILYVLAIVAALFAAVWLPDRLASKDTTDPVVEDSPAEGDGDRTP